MKVVLFCGGLGTRLREHSETVPKPLVNVGYRPIIWHLMRYYAHYGHKDFILCLGYRGDMIREYFLKYDECLTNDFVMSEGGKKIEPLTHDIQDWRITFVDTGLHSNLGQRLLRVRQYVQDEPMFLANYSDGLSDLPHDAYLERFQRSGAIAGLLAVRPAQSFHAIRADQTGLVSAVEPVAASGYWINGGYFCLRREIFDHIQPGEELVEQPFERLVGQRKLFAHMHDGFWAAMDTYKDKIRFDRLEASGDCPWMVWKKKS